MDTAESIANLRQRMAWEQDRGSPPANFPPFPPLPPGRSTSQEFFSLERQQKAVLSRGFVGYRLSYMERRIYYAHETIDRSIGVDRIPEHLRAVPMLDAHRELPDDHAADPLWRLDREVATA